VADDGTGTLRKSIFLNKLGPGYITQAFLWARQADPNAELILNEYHNAALTPKSDEVYALAKHLVQSVPGPIGVGIQMHIDATAPPDLSAFAANIQRLRALGVRVNISEMDVKIDDVTGSYATKLARQQVVYHKVVSTCLANGCEAVSFWGFTDAHTWIANDHPCLFDEAYGKKPAYFGVFDAFEGR